MIIEKPKIVRMEIGEHLGMIIKTVGSKIKDIGNIKYVVNGNNSYLETTEEI